jgi:hypothetical protein
MASFTITARGPAGTDKVWRDYVEPGRWPRWSPQIRRAELDGGGHRITAGATGRVWPALLPVPIPFTVVDVDEDALTWSWQIGSGPAMVTLSHAVEEAPTGTRTRLRLGSPLYLVPVVLSYAPLARLALHRLVHDGSSRHTHS